jgi:hypothetical protein
MKTLSATPALVAVTTTGQVVKPPLGAALPTSIRADPADAPK